jgi:hypothetical protein
MHRRALAATLTLTFAFLTPAGAEDFEEFSTQGLRESRGIVVRVRHPVGWKKVASDDEMAIAELRGPQGPLTGILQIARGRKRAGIDATCHPDRAPTMLQNLGAEEAGTRVREVFARNFDGRPGYELSYERNNAGDFLLVRGAIVCLKESRLLVTCGASGPRKGALLGIEPVCRQVLDSLTVTEE